MADHNGKITVDMDIHVVKEPRDCCATATLAWGELEDVQPAGSASVRWSPEHERYLVNAGWSDFWFFPTWETAFARFLTEVSERVLNLGREYAARSRVAINEEGHASKHPPKGLHAR